MIVTDTMEFMTTESDLVELPDSAAEIDLDPDWDEARRVAHRAIDGIIDFMSGVRERPVWQAPPPDALERLRAGGPPPAEGESLGTVLEQVQRDVLP
jgi:hypothetical protein